MEIIIQLTRRLVLVMIFAGFCELLLPSGKFRACIRFAVGLVIIALMLQPLAQLRGLRFEPENLLGIETAESQDIQGLGWVQAQSQDLVEAELVRQVAEFMAPEYPHCQVHVSLDVSFDEYGFLKEFRGMEVELCPAVEGIEPVVPVVIGKGVNTPAAGSGRPGLAEDLARHLGISAAKLQLRVYADGGSCP
ncbi:MAG: stage III sporulation protein AF [Eubacteriales bacterium]|nr:stage III sporulation protein AF [Eubacteriales bacterium]MDD3073476.1 stage III sporulation protein AF [Eubacteriales bacterium]